MFFHGFARNMAVLVKRDLLSSTCKWFISAKVMIHHNNQANKSLWFLWLTKESLYRLSGDVTPNQEVVIQPGEKQTQSHYQKRFNNNKGVAQEGVV